MNVNGSHAEEVVIKENWYDLNKYKDEIANFIVDRRRNLAGHSQMYRTYDILYRSIFTGSEDSDKRKRYPYLKEIYNVYKSALIEACLPGYSALFNSDARNAPTVLLNTKLKEVMLNQFKSIALIENLTANTISDWITKGEAVLFMKLKQTTERYREKETVTDLATGEELVQFKVDTGVTYEDIVIENIDPLDFYVDAMDYERDPKACPKIVRTYISSRDLLIDKTNYPLLSNDDKRTIIQKIESNKAYYNEHPRNGDDFSISKTASNQIEVLTFMGDYVTKDGNLLANIKAVTVEDKIALLEYNPVDTLQIIYAPYFIDRDTHRGVSPLASVIPIDDLANRCVDLFISNMDEVSKPILMYTAGSLPVNATKTFKINRELEYNDGIGTKPEFFTPPEISPNGMSLLEVLLAQQKEMLGLNKYMSGDTSGAVRTAQESSILFQKANARMRVETDVFSYKLLLPLISNFYAFNRELALAVGHPLDDIYANPELMVTISTGASKADGEGEVQKLMQILGMPAISQPIFQWCAESNNMPLAVRYIFAKLGLTDADNILGLIEHPEDIPPISESQDNPPEEPSNPMVSPDGNEQNNEAVQQILESMNEGGDILNG